MVKLLWDLLENGGTLCIKTPHGGETSSYFYPLLISSIYITKALRYNSVLTVIKATARRFWYCDPPRHLWSFTSASLRTIVKNADICPTCAHIAYYKLPLFEYSLTKACLCLGKNPGIKKIFLRILCLPLIALEIPLKLIQALLFQMGAINSAGIILKINKPFLEQAKLS